MVAKLAWEADLWYNEDLKLLSPENVEALPGRVNNLIRRLSTMDTLYPHDQNDNTPKKQCTACLNFIPATPKFFGRAKGGHYGVRSVCKECEKSGKHPIKALPDGKKTCKGPCGRTLDATPEFWHRDKNGKYGFTSRCKECNYQKRPGIPLPPYVCKIHGEVEPYLCPYPSRGKTKKREGLVRRLCPICKEMSEQKYSQRHHEVSRQWRQRNKDRVLANHRHWVASNLSRVSDYQRKRRARKRNVPGILTPDQIQAKLKSQRYKCYYCLVKLDNRKGRYVYQLDHVVPLSRIEERPRHDINFTVLTCKACNSRKHNKLLSEWTEGGRLL